MMMTTLIDKNNASNAFQNDLYIVPFFVPNFNLLFPNSSINWINIIEPPTLKLEFFIENHASNIQLNYRKKIIIILAWLAYSHMAVKLGVVVIILKTKILLLHLNTRTSCWHFFSPFIHSFKLTHWNKMFAPLMIMIIVIMTMIYSV